MEHLTTDVLVIGGGGAGGRAAIAARDAGAKVTVILKNMFSRSGITPMAFDSLEAVFSAADSLENHFDDTVRAGRYLGDQDLVEVLVSGAPQQIMDLERFGGRFKKNPDGSYYLLHVPGQSHGRSCQIHLGGFGIMRALLAEIKRRPGVTIRNDHLALELVKDGAAVVGCIALDVAKGELVTISAGATILATGGYEELWSFTDTPPESTGDGAVLAFDAGADLVDLEMQLYYPTVIVYPSVARGSMFPYELVVNPERLPGRFLNGKLAPFVTGFPVRDELVRMIYEQIRAGLAGPHQGVFLDLTSTPLDFETLTKRLEEQVPEQFKHLLALGVDIRREYLELAPAAHTSLGGVRIDSDCATCVPGLFAAGEAAGNVHGANRLSGNALSEVLVFGARAGAAAATAAAGAAGSGRTVLTERGEVLRSQCRQLTRPRQDGVRPIAVKRRLQEIMWQHCGPVRDGEGLALARRLLDELAEGWIPRLAAWGGSSYVYELAEAFEVRNMVRLAAMVVAAAAARRESRGHHFRSDYPESDPAWQRHTLVRRDTGGGPSLATAPVVTKVPHWRENHD